MRTTITFDDDTAALVESVRRRRGVGVSEAVNSLIRQVGATSRPRRSFTQRTAPLGLRVDIRNTADALELLEEPRPSA